MIRIIGAGPAGCFTALKLADAGKQTTVFEEHASVGKPVQCTGIVTNTFTKFFSSNNDFVINKIRNVRIYSPENKSISMEFKKPDLIIDRHLFDKHIAGKAEDKGVEIKLQSKFLGIEGSSMLVKDIREKKTRKIQFSHLVGADGPLSSVARSAAMFGKRQFWHGAQARVKLKNDNTVEFYPHIGLFAWLVPEDHNTARIGVLAKTNLKNHFNSFIRRFKCKIIEHQGGIVPVYNQKIMTQKDNIYLVGDAACQVKATTGGGLIPSLTAADALAESIINNQDYDRKWRKRIGRELWTALLMRKTLNKFSRKDYIDLINICSSKKAKNILQKHDRDHPSSIILKLAAAEPRLLKFITKLI